MTQGRDLVFAVKLKADGSGLVGQARAAKEEVKQLGDATAAAGARAAGASRDAAQLGGVARALAADAGQATAELKTMAAEAGAAGSGASALARDLVATNALIREVVSGIAALHSTFAQFIDDQRQAAASATELGKANRGASAATDGYASDLARLRAEIDPIGESQRRMALAVDLATTAFHRGDLSADEYALALKRAEAAGRGQITSLNQQRQSTIQAGQQVQDFFVQVQNGGSIGTAFSQQIGQLGFAVQGMGGKMAGVAAFLSSGWGIALGIAVSVAAPFIGKLFETSDGAEKAKDSLDELVAKKAEDAKQSALTAQASDIFAHSVAGVTEALRKQNDELDKSIRNLGRSAAEQENIAAKNKLEGARRTQAASIDKLNTARTALKVVQEEGPPSIVTNDNGAAQLAYLRRLAAAEAAVTAARAENVAAAKGILAAEIGINLTRVKLAGEVAATEADSTKRIAKFYDTRIADLQRVADAEAKAGKTIDGTLTNEIRRLTEAKEAALKNDRERIASIERRQKAEAKAGPLTSFISPIDGGRISSGFGPRVAPTKGASTFHPAIDIAAPIGTNVRAAASGLVIYAGTLPGLGNAIIVDHGGGTITEYGHLSKILTAKNARVDQGASIGEVGNTGISTGPHLDYRVKVGGKYVDPRKGAFRTDDTTIGVRAAEAAQRAASTAATEEKRLSEFGDRAADSIARVSTEFGVQETAVRRAALATHSLDDLIVDLGTRKPPGFEALIAQANAAKVAIVDGIDRPIRDFIQSQQESYQIGQLVLGGHQAEADALRIILSIERERGPLAEDQKAAILGTVEALRAQERETERVQRRQQALVGAVDDVRRIVTDTIFDPKSIADLPAKLFDSFKRTASELITEDLFGGIFDKLRDEAKGTTTIEDASARYGTAVDTVTGKVKTTGTALDDLAASARNAKSGLACSSALPGTPDPLSSAIPGLDVLTGAISSVAPGLQSIPDLIDSVLGIDTSVASPVSLGPIDIPGLAPLTRAITAVTPGLKSLPDLVDGVLGTATGNSVFAQQEGPKKQSAGDIYGKQIGELAKKIGISDQAASTIGKVAGKGLAGAFEGQAAAGVASLFGIKTSSTGAAIGGAIGNFLPIPGGSIIGGLLGGVVGGLFKKATKGSVSITGAETSSYKGSGKFADGLNSDASSVQSSLQKIADQFGASIGAFDVAIGKRDEYFHVAGSSSVNVTAKHPSGLIYEGKDEAAAVRAALADAIKDGALLGLSKAVTAALGSTGDIDKAISDALKVSQLELDLGGVTAQIEKVFKDFDHTAAERVSLAKKYGLDLLAVEKLNAEQRADLLDETLKSRVGSLKDLQKDLQYGDLFEGDASTRRDAILGEIADAKQDQEAGIEGAADRLADLYRRLIDTSEEAFGTAGPELVADRSAATDGLARAIEIEEERVQAAADQAKATVAAVASVGAGIDVSNDLLAQISRGIDVIASGGAGGATFLPDLSMVVRSR